jgi:predicted amidohydrolase
MEHARVMVVEQLTELAIFDLDARLERACELIVDAGQAGARWILFPEGYLPGAPTWLWSGPHDNGIVRDLYARALASTVGIPSYTIDRLCRVALRSRIGVAMGLIERDNDTCYSSLLFIDVYGRICEHYRSSMGSTNRQQGWNSVVRTTAVLMTKTDGQHEWAGGI